MHDDINGQKSKARDILSTVKRVCRESSFEEDPIIKDKMDDLRTQADNCAKLSTERLGVLEQSVPLTAHFDETYDELLQWLDDAEEQVKQQDHPAVTAEQIREQQERVKVCSL